MEITRELIDLFARWTKLKLQTHVSERAENFYFYEREIWWASLGVNIGFEQNGKNDLYERPVLVLRKFNKDVLWVLPLTTKQKKNKFHVQTEYNGEVFSIILSQIRLISSKRLLRNIRTLPENEFAEVRKCVKEFL